MRKPPPEETRWKPGQSGNPNGRPPGQAKFRRLLEEELRRYQEVEIGGRKQKVKKERLVAMALINQTIKGNGFMAKHFLERWLGKEPLPVEHSGEVAHELGGKVNVETRYTVADLHRVLAEEKQKREARETKRDAKNGNNRKH